MAKPSASDNASNASAPKSTDAPKTISPAARKFAQYLERRMGPMIEHAARNNVPKPADDCEGRRLH